MGNVNIQAAIILPAIPHLTAEKRVVEPTPITAALIQCVVLTGMPKCEATSTTVAAEDVAAKPCIWRKLVTLIPIVRITRQPPNAVPVLIASAETTIIHQVSEFSSESRSHSVGS